ncbi:hypothetical protein [Shewanella sp. NIFS-20-20]|uniref:hypothetical protein n=1 Tax=Shewanella sp. NIFS-20-20 TaxID=2853806 RepID=UPI001C466470|nr:hypothetical protein [Shewanella sp. NIFS-20-20]MBV7314716.1 hypothetical protein [Shewanella sp. NIFS-20-20]
MNKEKLGLFILAIVISAFGIYAFEGSRQVLSEFGIDSPWPIIGIFALLGPLTWCANRWFWPTLLVCITLPLTIIFFG